MNSSPCACCGSTGQKALVWFDDTDISVFHSCVVVDLWQSLSEWHLLLSACFGVSELELEQQTNTKFLVKLGQSGNEIREMLVQVYGDNAVKKQKFTVGETFF